MLRTYNYFSKLSRYIEEFIAQKRTNGYSYESEAYIYTKFDEYCSVNDLSATDLTKENLAGWRTIRKTESKGFLSQRISSVRQLLIYINTLGIVTYIPQHFTNVEKNVPHILNDREIKEFFEQADLYLPKACTPTCADANARPEFMRMACEYKVLFRLIYCCGLRNSEACDLKWENFRPTEKTIIIIHSKGDKDRLVYLNENLTHLIIKYRSDLFEKSGQESPWIFPGMCPKEKMLKTTIDRKFNEFWQKTHCSVECDKKPTVHSLRHTFVVKRMNLWMDQGISLNVMMPYLSKFLGHGGRGETYYYYHQVDAAFKIIRQKDSRTATIIPEVAADE